MAFKADCTSVILGWGPVNAVPIDPPHPCNEDFQVRVGRYPVLRGQAWIPGANPRRVAIYPKNREDQQLLVSEIGHNERGRQTTRGL